MRNIDEAMRRTTPRQRMALKTATETTIDVIGGGESAQYSTRVKEAMLCRCASRNYEDFLAIDVAADLQIAAGYPYIAEAMCRMMGYGIVKVDGDVKAPSVEDCNPIASAAAEYFIAHVKAWADNNLDAAELRELSALLIALERKVREQSDNIAHFAPRTQAAE